LPRKSKSDIDISDRLKAARVAAGLSQRRLAEQLGVAVRAYQYYERHTTHPNYTHLVMIADILNVTTDYLLGRTTEEDEKEDNEISQDEAQG
jgi:transcriptional regulator with XRE-family HTH domain